MSEQLTFLPWLRRGLVQSLDTADPGTGPLALNTIAAWVEVSGQRAERAINLNTPDQVVAIDSGQIIRRYPQPGAVDSEPNYFPLIELFTADFPWLFTPAAANAAQRLRPWLALVCVTADQVGLIDTGEATQTLTVPADLVAVELPGIDDLWAWAHVQTTIPVADVAGAVESGNGTVTARLICPRHLEPYTTYRCALVPTFARQDEELIPAWRADEEARLRVYDTWTFTTGAQGDFEALCRRLHPGTEGGPIGLRPMEVSEMGGIEPFPGTGEVLIDYSGPLLDVNANPDGLTRIERQRYQAAIKEMLNQGRVTTTPVTDDEYDPSDDPVLTPPFYGSWHSGLTEVPEQGWVEDVNAIISRRAAAGLGAAAIHAGQEEFLASAWDQVEELRETNLELNRARLGVEVGRSWTRRLNELDAADRVQAAGRLLTFVTSDGEPALKQLHQSAAPNGVVSAAFTRITRVGGIAARARQRSGLAAPRKATTDTYLKATVPNPPADVVSSIAFSAPSLPDGAHLDDPTRLEEYEVATHADGPRIDEISQVLDQSPALGYRADPPAYRANLRSGGFRARIAPGILGPESLGGGKSIIVGGGGEPSDTVPVVTSSVDLSALGEAVSESLDVVAATNAGLKARIPAVEPYLLADEVITRITQNPQFETVLFERLYQLSREYVLAGADGLEPNTVRLVATNPGFVAAFMVGANHEMSREFLWREFPSDLGATFFHRFWNNAGGADDISAIAGWDIDESLRTFAESGADTVVIVRGDLIERYPTVRIYLIDPAGNTAEPTFHGRLGTRAVFVGFDCSPQDVLHQDGWLVAFEEQPSEPRFGADLGEDADAEPSSWDDLAWPHLGDGSHVNAAAPLPATGANTDFDGVVWGHNAAHMARITYQSPFRMLFPAAELIGDPGVSQ